MWHVSSPYQGCNCEKQSFNHCTSREVPGIFFYVNMFKKKKLRLSRQLVWDQGYVHDETRGSNTGPLWPWGKRPLSGRAAVAGAQTSRQKLQEVRGPGWSWAGRRQGGGLSHGRREVGSLWRDWGRMRHLGYCETSEGSPERTLGPEGWCWAPGFPLCQSTQGHCLTQGTSRTPAVPALGSRLSGPGRMDRYPHVFPAPARRECKPPPKAH